MLKIRLPRPPGALLLLSLATFQSGCGLLKKRADDLVEGSGFGARQKANFASWKLNPRKACTAAAAFEGKAENAEIGLDALAVLEKTAGSLAVRDASGGFLLLGAGYDMVGTSRSTLGREISVNGAESSFEGEVERHGSRCVVKIGGEQVYETEILASIPVLAFGRGRLATPVATPAFLRATDVGLEEHGLLDAVFSGAVRPAELDAEVAALLPFTAEWTPAERRRLFPGERLGGRHLAFFPPEAGLVPFDASHPAIVGAEASWRALAQVAGETSFELYVEPPVFAREGFGNQADTGLWRLVVTVAWRSDAKAQPLYELTSIALAEGAPFDGARMAACMQQRQTMFAGTKIYGNGAFAPHFDGVLGPCGTLAGNTDRALYEIPAARDLVLAHFAAVSGRPGAFFGGWDVGLAALARLAASRQEGIAAELDPESASPLIQQLDLYARALGVKAADYVEVLALAWALRGDEVDPALIGRFVEGIQRAELPFPESVAAWISDLAALPNAPEQASRADYAVALADEVLAGVLDARRAALAGGLDGAFADVKLAKVIQDAAPVAALLPSWNQTIAALADFRKRDLLRVETGTSEFTFEGKFLDLARRGLAEDWSETDLFHVEKLVALAANDEFCFGRDVSSLVACKNAAAFSRSPQGLLAPERVAAYVTLAADLAPLVKKAVDGSDWMLKMDLMRAFYEPVWKACDAGAIEANRASLLSLIAARKKAETFDQFDYDRKISELLDACSR